MAQSHDDTSESESDSGNPPPKTEGGTKKETKPSTRRRVAAVARSAAAGARRLLIAKTKRAVCDFSLKTVMEVSLLVVGLLIVFDVVGVGAHFEDYGRVGIYSPSFVLNAKHSAGYMTGCAASSLLREDTVVQSSCAWFYGVLSIPLLGGQLNGNLQFGGLASWGNLLNGTSPGYRNVTRGTSATSYGQGWVGLQYTSLIFLIITAIVVTLVNLWICAATLAPESMGWKINQTDEFRYSYAAAEGESGVRYPKWDHTAMVDKIEELTEKKEFPLVGVGALCREWGGACRTKFGACSVLMQLCSMVYGGLVMAEAILGLCAMLYPNGVYFPSYDSPQFTLAVFMGALSREVTYMFADTRLMFRRPMVIVFLWCGTVAGLSMSTAAFIQNQKVVNLSGGASPSFHSWCARTPACYAALAASGGPFVDWGAATYYYLGGVAPLYAYWSTLASYFELFMLLFAWLGWFFQSCRMILLGCSYSVDLNDEWNKRDPNDVAEEKMGDEEEPLKREKSQMSEEGKKRKAEMDRASTNWFWILCSCGKDARHHQKVQEANRGGTERDPGKYCDIFWWCAKSKLKGMRKGTRVKAAAALQQTTAPSDSVSDTATETDEDADAGSVGTVPSED